MKMLSLAIALLAAQAPAPAPVVAPPAAPTSIPGMAAVPGRPSLLQTGVAPVPEKIWQRAEQLLEARSASLLDVSANGESILISTRFGQSTQLHVVDRAMGARTQITFGREPVTSGAFQPGDPMVVYFRRDIGGSENWQVYRHDRRTGRTELLTDGKSRHDGLVLSPDGKRLAYGGTGRNGKDTDVYVAETARPGEARRLFEAEGTWQPVDFSRDGSQLLVRRFRSIADSDLFLVDVASGTRRALTPSTGQASVGAARFSADGKAVYLVTDRQGDFSELYRLELSDPAASPRPLTRTLRWNVEGLAVAKDGSRVALTVNADGASRLYFLEPRSGKLSTGELPAGRGRGPQVPGREARHALLRAHHAALAGRRLAGDPGEEGPGALDLVGDGRDRPGHSRRTHAGAVSRPGTGPPSRRGSTSRRGRASGRS